MFVSNRSSFSGRIFEFITCDDDVSLLFTTIINDQIRWLTPEDQLVHLLSPSLLGDWWPIDVVACIHLQLTETSLGKRIVIRYHHECQLDDAQQVMKCRRWSSFFLLTQSNDQVKRNSSRRIFLPCNQSRKSQQTFFSVSLSLSDHHYRWSSILRETNGYRWLVRDRCCCCS